MTADLLWTPEQAAEHLHVSTKTLRQLRQRGLIRYVGVTERKICYRPEDCRDYVERQSRLSQALPPASARRGKRAGGKTGNVVSIKTFTARQGGRSGRL